MENVLFPSLPVARGDYGIHVSSSLQVEMAVTTFSKEWREKYRKQFSSANKLYKSNRDSHKTWGTRFNNSHVPRPRDKILKEKQLMHFSPLNVITGK